MDVGNNNKYIPTYGDSLLSVKRVLNVIDNATRAKPNKKTQVKSIFYVPPIFSGGAYVQKTPKLTKSAEKNTKKS